MNWTITKEIIAKGDIDATVKVTAVSGQTTIDRTFTGVKSPEGLKEAVRSWLDAYEDIQTFEDGDLDITEETPTPTTPDADRVAYDEEREKLRRVMELVRDGVLAEDNAQVTALQTSVRNKFDITYLD